MKYYDTEAYETVLDWGYLVVEPLKRMLVQIVGFIPNIVTALLILLVGWIIAHISKCVVSKFMKVIGFNSVAEKIGISGIEGEGDKKIEPNYLVGAIAFWGVIFTTVIIILNNLQLRTLSFHLDRLFSYVVTILITATLAVVGIVLSMIVYKIIFSTAKSTGFAKPELSANISRWVILFFTSIMCLYQIGIDIEMLLMPAAIILVTLCITFVLAFGMGGRSWAEKMLNKIGEKRDSQGTDM